MSFEQNKYQVIRNAISYDLANFCFNYFLLKRDAIKFMYDNNFIAENSMHGTWKDKQVPGVYSIYADHVMETLLVKTLPVMKEKTGLNLLPTYSYARVYEKGSILEKHKDRPSCEISTTINLGGDLWSIYVEGIKIDLNPGDMLIYAGCELEHWREPFEGSICGQVFLHYNHVDGPFAKTNLYDKRPLLGVPNIR
tara:strand:- start:576 stop:1160 length:585 start_codon:yes stop_codon:yes gene_type:complete